ALAGARAAWWKLSGPMCVIAAGKAAIPMARATRDLFGDRIRAGLIVGVESPATVETDGGFPVIVGGHPTPSAASEQVGRRALGRAASLGSDETLLVLLSGGASALMAVPADGVTLEDKQAATRQLLRAGADIHALNTVRKHLSAIKGGRLAARSAGPCVAFAISDVVGDDLSVIASGPTVPDASTFRDALDILRRFGGEDAYPRAVVSHLASGAQGRLPETPKPNDPRLARAHTSVIGSR